MVKKTRNKARIDLNKENRANENNDEQTIDDVSKEDKPETKDNDSIWLQVIKNSLNGLAQTTFKSVRLVSQLIYPVKESVINVTTTINDVPTKLIGQAEPAAVINFTGSSTGSFTD